MSTSAGSSEEAYGLEGESWRLLCASCRDRLKDSLTAIPYFHSRLSAIADDLVMGVLNFLGIIVNDFPSHSNNAKISLAAAITSMRTPQLVDNVMLDAYCEEHVGEAFDALALDF